MRGRKVFIAALSCATALGGLTLTGCKEEPPPPPPPPPAPPPPPPAPEPINVDSLLSEMDADARLVFPQDVAPVDADLARAVVNFAEAFLEGDDSAARSMLDLTGQAVLDRLLVTGGWYDATDELEAVHVVDLSEYGSGQGGSVTYALQTPGSAYTLSWNVEPGPGGELAFSGADSSSEERPRASDFAGGTYEPDTSATSAPPPLPDESALMMYVGMETTTILMQNVLGVSMTPEAIFQQARAFIPEGEFETAQQMFEEGKAADAQGEKLNAAEVRGLVDTLDAQISAQLAMVAEGAEGMPSITKDDIIQALAEAMNISASEVENLYNGG